MAETAPSSVENLANSIVAAELGAAGCVSKGAPLEALVSAIRVLK